MTSDVRRRLTQAACWFPRRKLRAAGLGQEEEAGPSNGRQSSAEQRATKKFKKKFHLCSARISPAIAKVIDPTSSPPPKKTLPPPESATEMLCQRCRRVAFLAVRRLGSSPTPRSSTSQLSRAQSTLPLAASRRSTPATSAAAAVARRYPTVAASLRYSTSPETAAAAEGSSGQPALPEKPDFLDEAESAIWDKLAAEFDPTELTVQDISGGCGSMYGIEIASEKFRGANMLKQQRMVNAVLGDQMKGWHGVQLRTRVPS